VIRISVLLAALALASSATVPFGFMPDVAQDGGFILSICDGTKPAPPSPTEASEHSQHQMSRDHTSSGKAGHGHEPHKMRCDFAVAATADLPAPPQIVLVRNKDLRPRQPRRAVLTAIFPAKLPPSTGPPVV